jgi:glutaredoxin
MKKKEIVVFYCSVCGLCTKAIEFLRSRNLDFTAYAVEWDSEKNAFRDSKNTREMFCRCGGTVDFVPQFFIHGIHVAGWRKLEPLIENGEFDRLLQNP